MQFCFIVEARYRHEVMPMAVVQQLRSWGNRVDLLEPDLTITCLSKLVEQDYDAYVLKTVSDGPGLSILKAVEAIGIPTINNAQAILTIRDKAVAAAIARAHGLPIPHTYFVTHLQQLDQIAETAYPLVIKPNNGSSCQDIYRVNNAADLATLNIVARNARYFLAQRYIDNSGFDIKLYVVGKEVFAVAKPSPLHPDICIEKHLLPITFELRQLALQVGNIFGLDIYGLDVVGTPNGPVIVDINDFPSFGYVPHAARRVAKHILQQATHRRLERSYLPRAVRGPKTVPPVQLAAQQKSSVVNWKGKQSALSL